LFDTGYQYLTVIPITMSSWAAEEVAKSAHRGRPRICRTNSFHRLFMSYLWLWWHYSCDCVHIFCYNVKCWY